MVRLVFIAVDDHTAGGTSAIRVLRRLRPRGALPVFGLTPIRYPAPRRMFRTRVEADLPMRSGWLKPVSGSLPGAMWSTWWTRGLIPSGGWSLNG